MTTFLATPSIGKGAYTLPDAAKILELDLQSLRRWVALGGGGNATAKPRLAGPIAFWGHGRDRGLNFNSLIELYTIARLRELGVSMARIRTARSDLRDRFGRDYPFATQGLLSDGKRILVELEETGQQSTLRLDRSGQIAFTGLIREFCHKIDFATSTELAEKFWPQGKDSSVVVDPRCAFGRPVIAGTAIPTETLVDLLDAGEMEEDVCEMYNLTSRQISDARRFEYRLAA